MWKNEQRTRYALRSDGNKKTNIDGLAGNFLDDVFLVTKVKLSFSVVIMSVYILHAVQKNSGTDLDIVKYRHQNGWNIC